MAIVTSQIGLASVGRIAVTIFPAGSTGGGAGGIAGTTVSRPISQVSLAPVAQITVAVLPPVLAPKQLIGKLVAGALSYNTTIHHGVGLIAAHVAGTALTAGSYIALAPVCPITITIIEVGSIFTKDITSGVFANANAGCIIVCQGARGIASSAMIRVTSQVCLASIGVVAVTICEARAA